MKKNLSAIALLILTAVVATFAQDTKVAPKMPIDETSKLITYSNVVEMGSTKKDELFGKALAWCNTYYKNPADVIRQKDLEAGTIQCKARFKISNPVDKNRVATDAGIVQYTLNLAFKDGKYKYTLTEINWKQVSYYPAEKWMDKTSKSYLPEFDYYLQQVNEEALKIVKDLEKNMKATEVIKKGDW
jgi:hypothetical protein